MSGGLDHAPAHPACSAGELEISALRPAEHARLIDVTLAAYRALGPVPESYAAHLADVTGRAADPDAAVLVARRDGVVVGGVTVVLDPRSPLAERLEPGDAGMRMLAVDPAAQGCGVGRALVEATIDLARRQRLRRVALHTTEGMRTARRLYESLGFRRHAERDIHLESGLHLLAYELPVG